RTASGSWCGPASSRRRAPGCSRPDRIARVARDAEPHAARPVGRLRPAGRRPVRIARAGPQSLVGPVAAGEPLALRPGPPRRVSHLPARPRLPPGAVAGRRPHRAGVLRPRRGAPRRLRAVPRHRVHLAARHLRARGDPRVAHPVVLDGRLPALRDAVGERVHPRGPALRPDARAARVPDRGHPGRCHLGVAALHLRGQGAARGRRGPRDGGRVRREPPRPRLRALRHQRGLRRRGGRVHRAHLDAGAGADLGLARHGLRGGDHRRPRQSGGRAAGGIPDRRQRVGHDGRRRTGVGAVVFRVKRLRGELFGLLTLAITFVLATIVLNTRLDGGPGVYLSNVPLPRLVASPTGTFYLLALGLAVLTLAAAYTITSSRLGLGLFAIHDDEDVAEVEGVPTFAYKLVAFALSAGIAGVAGGIHAMYVSYLTVP